MKWLAGFWVLLWTGVPACSAQGNVPSDVLLLSRIRAHIADHLTKLPNYTCLQTIERSRRRAPSNRYELVDTIRLEVALVGNRELFAWPGAGEFEEKELREMVHGGATGTGNFALHAYSVFLSNAPTFTYAGEETRDKRRTFRFDYHVPFISSGYRLRIPPHEAIVGYQGSFWADAETLDLVRLEVHADKIPPHLGLLSAFDAVDYARVPIGDKDFLLPRASELVMLDVNGNESRNRVLFTDCRQFTGESVLTFAEPPPADREAGLEAALREIEFPAGLSLELRLRDEIDSEKSFVGDPVSAVVHSDVRRDGAVVVPKGARVLGRITRLQRGPGPRAHFIVGLRFFTVEFDGGRGRFLARLEEAGPTFLSNLSLEDASPGHGVLMVNGTRVRLRPGFRMIWRTESKSETETP